MWFPPPSTWAWWCQEEALEKLKAAETAALSAPQTAEPTADVTAEPAEEESLPATDTSVLAAAVTTDALYIRRSGDWDAEALALVGYGTTVAVTGKSGGWYQVRYDGTEGYLSGEYLDLRTSGLTGYGQVTADALNLRSGAGTGYETVISLPNGAWVSVSRFENGWFYVDYDGVSGYVSGDYLELSASRPQPGGDTSSDSGSSGGSDDLPSGGDAGTVSGSASDLVALALSYQGVPYAYGGASSSGFDCSGYTMYIYQRFGVYLPHGATDQLQLRHGGGLRGTAAGGSGVLSGCGFLLQRRLPLRHLHRRRTVHPRHLRFPLQLC